MEELVSQLIKSGYLKIPEIVEAFIKIDRVDFVPDSLRDLAYVNEPLAIGEGQTISQPLTVAFMLELLELAPGQKVLDVGTGSGWQAALLAEIVGLHGKVISIERIKSLLEQAQYNLLKFHFNNLELVIGDGSLGYPDEAPYDRIVAAAVAKEIPQAWKDQLKIGGIIVAPRGGSLVKLIKYNAAEFKEEDFPGFVFVPLIRNNE
ncbi:MAG: protein-L-isoaspartate(D-aspartate) O-methyltransferase [Patescibacteria group bacterium]